MKYEILKIILFVVFISICIFISKILFELIYYSDMPVFLKYILLS